MYSPQDKTTPLFMSAMGGYADVMQALIEAGAEVEVECGDPAVTEVRIAWIARCDDGADCLDWNPPYHPLAPRIILRTVKELSLLFLRL